jgi:hypothetical protein
MFTKLYLDTTNPKLKFYELFQQSILVPMIISILFHTVVYIAFFNLANYIFFGKILSNKVNIRLTLSSLLIMIFGFIGRYYHVKEVYQEYNENMEKTRDYLDKLYIT